MGAILWLVTRDKFSREFVVIGNSYIKEEVVERFPSLQMCPLRVIIRP